MKRWPRSTSPMAHGRSVEADTLSYLLGCLHSASGPEEMLCPVQKVTSPKKRRSVGLLWGWEFAAFWQVYLEFLK